MRRKWATPVDTRTDRTDEELLASHETDDFGVFYDRHVRALLGYFQRRTGDPQVAADLTAETFASAIVAQKRYVPTGAPALAWLYRIASRRLVDYQRRGAVERKMQRALSMERPRLSGEDAAMIRLLADDAALSRSTELPRDQREAVTAHVIGGEGYAELARAQRHVGGRGPPARLARPRHAAPADGRARMSDFVTELRREVVGAHAAAPRLRGPHPPPPPAAGPGRRGRARGAARRGRAGLALDPAARADRRAARGQGRAHRRRPDRRRCSPPARCGSPTSRATRSSASTRPAKVIARIPIGNAPENIAADNESVWANTTTTEATTILWRINSATNRVADHINNDYAIGLAATPGRVWLARRDDQHSVDVFSSADGRRIGRIPFEGVTGLAAAGGSVWVAGADGTVTRIGERSGKIEHSWPQLVPSNIGFGSRSIAADRSGAWLVDSGQGRLLRLEGDKVVRSLQIGDTTPILARSNGLWVVTSDEPQASAVDRIDPRTGKVTATVQLGTALPARARPRARRTLGDRRRWDCRADRHLGRWPGAPPPPARRARSGSVRSRRGGLTAGAEPPEGHLGLVDREAVALRRPQARGLADDAIDVLGGVAHAADEVVVVVADARLVAHGATGGGDAPGEPGAVQRLADVVGRWVEREVSRSPARCPRRHDGEIEAPAVCIFHRSAVLAVAATLILGAANASAAITLRASGNTVVLEDATGSNETIIGYEADRLTVQNTDGSEFGIKRGLAVRLQCAAACKVVATLSFKGKRLGAGRKTLRRRALRDSQ